MLRKRDVEVRKVKRRRCHPCSHNRPPLQPIPVSTEPAHQQTAVTMHGGGCGCQLCPVLLTTRPLAAWMEGDKLFTAR